MTKPRADIADRDPLTDEEIVGMLAKADKLEMGTGVLQQYFRLRAKAIVAIAKVFGKRRAEIAAIEMKGLRVEGDLLLITFKLRKKRKKGLFQYTRFLEGKIKRGEMAYAELESKTQGELNEEWREWQKTKEGVRIKETKVTKAVSIDSKFGRIILDYITFIRKKVPKSKYLFPAGKETIQGAAVYIMDMNNHIGGRTLLNVVKELNPDVWMHLFRERKGEDIAKKKGRTIEGVYAVKNTLDLEEEDTAWHYIKRFAVQEMKGD
jgi:hypothetical protein